MSFHAFLLLASLEHNARGSALPGSGATTLSTWPQGSVGIVNHRPSTGDSGMQAGVDSGKETDPCWLPAARVDAESVT